MCESHHKAFEYRVTQTIGDCLFCKWCALSAPVHGLSSLRLTCKRNLRKRDCLVPIWKVIRIRPPNWQSFQVTIKKNEKPPSSIWKSPHDYPMNQARSPSLIWKPPVSKDKYLSCEIAQDTLSCKSHQLFWNEHTESLWGYFQSRTSQTRLLNLLKQPYQIYIASRQCLPEKWKIDLRT